MVTNHTARKIEEHLRKNDIWADVYVHDEKTLAVEIERGDWKHDHLKADYIMSNIGYRNIKQTITEDDGSDCYSAVYLYTSY